MLFLQPMLVNARALFDGLFPRARAAGKHHPAEPVASASKAEAIGVPEECAAPPADPRLEAQLVMRRVRHFDEDAEKG